MSEGRWQIEECFRIMKTDFFCTAHLSSRRRTRITAHFLICFLALLSYRILEKRLGYRYTCEEILNTFKSPELRRDSRTGICTLYERERITDELHNVLWLSQTMNF